MSEYDIRNPGDKINWKHPKTAIPAEIRDNDHIAIKVVAVAGFANDWSAYEGPMDWPDLKVAQQGSKLSAIQAKPLFFAMRNSGRYYRD